MHWDHSVEGWYQAVEGSWWNIAIATKAAIVIKLEHQWVQTQCACSYSVLLVASYIAIAS